MHALTKPRSFRTYIVDVAVQNMSFDIEIFLQNTCKVPIEAALPLEAAVTPLGLLTSKLLFYTVSQKKSAKMSLSYLLQKLIGF